MPTKITFIVLFILLFAFSVNSLNVGYGQGNNYVSIGSPAVVDTSNEKDPRWSANLTNMMVDASAGNCVYGFFGNGSIKPRACSGGTGGSSYNVTYENKLDSQTGNSTYCYYNASSQIMNCKIMFSNITGYNNSVIDLMTGISKLLYNMSGAFYYNQSDGTGITSAIGNMTYVISNTTFSLLNNNKTVIDLLTAYGSTWNNIMFNITYQNFAYNMSDGTGMTSPIANMTYVISNTTFNLLNNNLTVNQLMTGISIWLMNETQASNMSFWNTYHLQWESSLSYNGTYPRLNSGARNVYTSLNSFNKGLEINVLGENLTIPYNNIHNFTLGGGSLVWLPNTGNYIPLYLVKGVLPTGTVYNFTGRSIDFIYLNFGAKNAEINLQNGYLYLKPQEITIGGACNKGYFASNLTGNHCSCIGATGTTGTWRCSNF